MCQYNTDIISSMLIWRIATGVEYLRLLRERETAAGLRGDPETDAFLKASALQGKRHSVVTEYMLRLLGLDVRPEPPAVSVSRPLSARTQRVLLACACVLFSLCKKQ